MLLTRHTPHAKTPSATWAHASLWVLPGVLAAAAGLLFLNPLRPALSLTAGEGQWLLSSPGLARTLIDAWVGAVGDDWFMRLPVAAVAVLTVVLVYVALAPRAGRLPALGAALALAAQQALLFGPFLVASIAPWAALTAGASVLLLGRGSRRPWLGLLVIAGVGALLEPGLAPLPIGAALGMLVARFGGRIRAADGARPAVPADSGRWLGIAACLLLAGLLLLHPPLPWHSGAHRTLVSVLQKLILVGGAVTLALAASSASSRTRARTGTHGELVFASLGGFIACLAWLLVPALRARSTAPLLELLCAAPALAVLAASAASLPAMAPETADLAPLRGSRGLLSPLAPLSLAVAGPALAIVSLLAWGSSRRIAPPTLPLREALDAIAAARPRIQEVIPGPGLSPGALSHAARPGPLRVTRRPSGNEVGIVSIAARKPKRSERDDLAERTGDRVLDVYGIVDGDGPSLKWGVLRPFHLSIGSRTERPNIVILSVDTLRADHLPVYGYARATAPRIGRWAEEALVYDKAMAAAPSTAPSFSSLLTGRLPVGHGVRKNYEYLDPGNWTLPRVLKRAGYETAGFVSSFVLRSDNSGLDLGFDDYDERFDVREKNRENRPLRLAPDLTRAVASWLDRRTPEGNPWFLWVHAIDPHGPYTPLPDYQKAFQGGPRRILPRKAIPDYQWLGSLDYASYVDAYDSEILQTDTYLGQIIDKIEALPSSRGTVLIFVADHGEAFGEHEVFFQHGQSLHDEEIHVPLIFKDSALPRSGRVATPVSLLDVMPTLLARLGIETDLPFDGIPLNEREREGRPVLSIWRPGEVMAFQHPWKLMIDNHRAGRASSRLYNLAEDPAESRPLSVADAGGASAGALLRDTRNLLIRDPLSPSSGRALDEQQWEGLDKEAIENLRSLGYAGP